MSNFLASTIQKKIVQKKNHRKKHSTKCILVLFEKSGIDRDFDIRVEIAMNKCMVWTATIGMGNGRIGCRMWGPEWGLGIESAGWENRN